MERWLWIILAALFFGLIAGDTIYPVEDEVNKREGESVSLRCNYETTSEDVYLYWYRHHSDLQAPQFILWKGARSITSDRIPDNRYTSETSRESTELTIKSLTLADTALYYCAVEYVFTFGKAIHLIVTPKEPDVIDPALFVLSALQPDSWESSPANKLGPEVCLATEFHPKDGEMVLNMRGGPLNLSTSNAVLSKSTSTYFYAGFTNRTIYSCELNDTQSNNDNIDLCADLHPEKAKLNFFLLVMNGLRIVFTKTLALNTLLTIRTLLF